MEREKNSIQKPKEMKLISALAAFAAAEWNGQSEDDPCGMQLSRASMVNSTCTVSGSNIKSMYAGNGAFIDSNGDLTGFDGISGDADVVVFFDQTCDADGNCDNSTCWDASISCTNNGEATSGYMFMETVNSATSTGNLNLQVANVGKGDTVTVSPVDANGNGVGLTNIRASGATASATESATGSFSVTAGDNFGALLQNLRRHRC